MAMNDEDDDMLFSMLFTALTVMVVLFVVGGVGLIISTSYTQYSVSWPSFSSSWESVPSSLF